jgi:hypothetical protein
MFSGQERRLREQALSTARILRPDARVSFKDSLFSLFMHFTGLQGRKSHMFGLNNPIGGGIHFLIFVSCMRLDLGSQTVVLDTGVLPITRSLVPRITRFLRAVTERGFCMSKLIAMNSNSEGKLCRHLQRGVEFGTTVAHAIMVQSWINRPRTTSTTSFALAAGVSLQKISCLMFQIGLMWLGWLQEQPYLQFSQSP